MSPIVKVVIGLAASLAAGWIHHGPLGHGEKLIDGLERQAEVAVAATNVPDIEVNLGRDPLSRAATLSGPADKIQRNGLGSLPGLTEIVAAVEGVAAVGWADERRGKQVPLLAEALFLIALSYLAGLALSWLFWGRPKKESFLGD